MWLLGALARSDGGLVEEPARDRHHPGREPASRLDPIEELPEANDQRALGVLAVLSRAGMAVPGRVSVAGYDHALPRLSLVDLTTVSRTARHAVRAAVERLDEGREGPREIVLAPLLGIKGSTGQAV
ncbi:substrate-binding domain-containing protein [Streptomyces sp. NRRL B-3648]|uniref:substrate-binding domain-containing protein n=1 Tax=Streptomyces sp. NRRL B-3648 TaxID=1519493 RepID=UPI0006AFDC90|nr:substrate-binding domain-containing protein [Streptomyces sp. NRRL B-3648]KOX11530.1 hypothetical protein ADL04_01205 [Streptomyces sp. NRRL B-3648]